MVTGVFMHTRRSLKPLLAVCWTAQAHSQMTFDLTGDLLHLLVLTLLVLL
jgi:hypothetical protein